MFAYLHTGFFEIEIESGTALRNGSGLVIISQGDTLRGTVRHCSAGLVAQGAYRGQRLSEARRRFPHALVLPERPAHYEKMNRLVTGFLVGKAPAVERSGMHGWFVDLTGCERLLRHDFAGWGVQMAGLLKANFGLTADVGIASNKVTCQLACSLAAGQSVMWLYPAGEQELISRTALDSLPGLTNAQRQLFKDRRLQWAWELKALGEDCLRQWFGSRDGGQIWRIIHGQCNDPIKPYRIPKILKKTHSFAEATACQQDVVQAGVYLAGALYHEVAKLGGAIHRMTCRLVYVDDLETSREIHVGGLVREQEQVAAAARMLENMVLRRVKLKLLQVRCPVEFEAAEQQDLFCEKDRLKRRDLDQALKDVRDKYGVESLHRVSGTVAKGQRHRGPRR